MIGKGCGITERFSAMTGKGDATEESGRSMIELLAVLTIIGILSLMALYGYRFAIDKAKANDIVDSVNKRALIASSQLMSEHKSIDLHEFWPDEEGDSILGFETEAHLPYSRDEEMFDITVYDVPEGVCNRILDMDYKAPRVIEVNSTVVATMREQVCRDSEDGLYDIVFAYSRDLRPDEWDGECRVDRDCIGSSNGPVCNQRSHVCMGVPLRSFHDAEDDEREYTCDTSLMIYTSKAECDKCENRIYLNHYCVIPCREGEWYAYGSGAAGREVMGGRRQPPAKCESCDMHGERKLMALDGAAWCDGLCGSKAYYSRSSDPYYYCGPKITQCEPGQFFGLYGCIDCSSPGTYTLAPPHAGGSDTNSDRVYVSSGAPCPRWFWTDGGCIIKGSKESCESCPAPYEREMVNGACVRKFNTAGKFRMYKKQIAQPILNYYNCDSKVAYNMAEINLQKNIEFCINDCKDYPPGRMALPDNTCVLATKCPDGSDPVDGKCSGCEAGKFMVDGRCVSCDDETAYNTTTKEQCEACGDKRAWVNVTTGSGERFYCFRKAGDGEYYTDGNGTRLCTDERASTAYTGPGLAACAMCGNTRVLGSTCYPGTAENTYYCLSHCPEGTFRTAANTCTPCGSEVSYKPWCVSTSSTDKNAVQQNCSTVCLGLRYNDNGICKRCPDGRFSRVGDTTTCSGRCNVDPITTPGACAACHREWDNSTGTCGVSCRDGQYLDYSGVCKECPADMTEIKDHVYCRACGGRWNIVSGNNCCPQDVTKIDQFAYCRDCYGVWSGGVCSFCPPDPNDGRPRYATDADANNCIRCPDYGEIKNELTCSVCRGRWDGTVCHSS